MKEETLKDKSSFRVWQKIFPTYMSGGDVVEWLEPWTHNVEAPGSSPLPDH